jgi:hypothetical protein
MVYAPDFTHDLELAVYGLETMTLKVEGQDDILLPSCVGDEPLEAGEIEPSAGQTLQQDQMFVWPKYRSPNRPPLGSCLVDSDGTYWTILHVQYRHLVETWRCHVRNLSIITAPINKAVAFKATYGKGRANEAKAQWHGLFSGKHPPTHEDVLTCRIQPAGEEAMIRFNADWTREAFRIILDKKLPMELAGGEYRIGDSEGNRYRIMRYFQEQRIDILPVCFAVRITEGAEFWKQGAPIPLPPPEFPTQP